MGQVAHQEKKIQNSKKRNKKGEKKNNNQKKNGKYTLSCRFHHRTGTEVVQKHEKKNIYIYIYIYVN